MVSVNDLTNLISVQDLIQAPLNLIFNIILPVFFLTWAFGLFLARIKLFTNSPVARYLIGVAMASFLVFSTKIGSIGIWLGLAGVIMFKLKDWPSRIISFLIVAILIFQIGFSTDPNVLLSKALFISFSIVALIVAMMDMRIWWKLIAVAIVYAAYFIILPYLSIFGF